MYTFIWLMIRAPGLGVGPHFSNVPVLSWLPTRNPVGCQVSLRRAGSCRTLHQASCASSLASFGSAFGSFRRDWSGEPTHCQAALIGFVGKFSSNVPFSIVMNFELTIYLPFGSQAHSEEKLAFSEIHEDSDLLILAFSRVIYLFGSSLGGGWCSCSPWAG